MKENLLKKRKKKGFTLIELIVVIAIIAIIALIAIPKVMGYQDDAKKKADVANAKSIANTLAVEIANGHIATTLNSRFAVVSNKTAPDSLTKPAATAADINYYITKNMQSIPTQQKNSSTSFYVIIDSTGSIEVYTAATDGDQLYPVPSSDYQ